MRYELTGLEWAVIEPCCRTGRALPISLGDPMTLVQSPISATLLGIAFIALVAPFVMQGMSRFKAQED